MTTASSQFNAQKDVELIAKKQAAVEKRAATNRAKPPTAAYTIRRLPHKPGEDAQTRTPRTEFLDYLKAMSPTVRAKFAKRCNTSVQYLQQIARGHRTPEVIACAVIEQASLKKIRCEYLRPDLQWLWEYFRPARAAREFKRLLELEASQKARKPRAKA